MQTLLQPSASGESAFFWLLQARIPRREPPSAAGLFQTLESGANNIPARGSRYGGGLDTLTDDDPEDGYEAHALQQWKRRGS